MGSLLRAELLRTVSGRALGGLLLIAVLLNAIAIFGASVAEIDAVRAGQLTLTDASHSLVRLGFGALLFSSLFGALLTTSEFRSGSVARSLFVSERPERLIAAKWVAALVTGLVFGVAAVASAVVTSAIVLEARGEQLLLDRESILIMVGVFAATTLAAPWGMLIGWVVRAQTATLVGLLAWTAIAEPAVNGLVPELGRFLPGGAQTAIYRGFDAGDAAVSTPAGYLLFAGWLAVAATAAVLLARRRDLA
jgi:hypothetical protein